MRTLVGIGLVAALVVLAAPWRGLVRAPRGAGGVPVVEVAVFEAGFGIDWHLNAARSYEHTRAGAGQPVEIDLWGDPRVLDKVRPRILARRPPTLLHGYPPFWTLMLGGVLLPFDEMLDQPAQGLPGRTVRDTFYAGALDAYTCGGRTYAIPTVYNAWVFWYDRRLFRERGWKVPCVWQELCALCDEIKAAGLAPVAFQGKYAVYANCYFWHLVQCCGGIELFDRCQAMEPGAFAEPAVIEAARLLQDFAARYFQAGSLSMTHTEAQTEFCQHRAALVACGLFFESEMNRVIPPEMELSAFPMPPLAGGRGNPRALYAGPMEALHLLKGGPNPGHGLAFTRHLLSIENMRAFASSKNTLVAVEQANQGADLSPAMQNVRAFVEQMTVRYLDALETRALGWEMQFRRPLTDKLIRGRITPEAFALELEKGAQLFRDDPDFVRPELTIRHASAARGHPRPRGGLPGGRDHMQSGSGATPAPLMQP